MLRDLLKGEDAEIAAAVAQIAQTAPDILVLANIDWDRGAAALAALSNVLRDAGHAMPHSFTARPNRGVPSGMDLNGNGRLGDPEDAYGYGRFTGEGGMAVLSTQPIATENVRDFTDLLWTDLPGAAAIAQPGERLSTTVHWVVPLETVNGPLDLLVFHATAPVFDGPEDHNGWRNADEIRFWSAYLDGAFGPPSGHPVVLAGVANLDPVDGEGRPQAIKDLLARPDVQDPRPASEGGVATADPDHQGDPALDTVDWPDGAPGNLRVAYILPDARLTIRNAGVFWPADPDPALFGEDGNAAGPHRIVWVDITLP
ncbi:endonuclease/exonuclease/phosphatase family protein [Aestuariibius sp. 2305UL40-4]|uniref:endonuclease/exonuclease/phosphatase family protein n=1 Tax=Aestuariibius violaceus TaxID=3234132 RepID=UPI00345E3E60